MRLWSIHPKYLDRMGLLALWRESLLAQAVLANKTIGYRNHPQLERFRSSEEPLHYIGTYLQTVANEAKYRGYSFDTSKILHFYDDLDRIDKMSVTNNQLFFEFSHLLIKLKKRDIERYRELSGIMEPEANPLFEVIEGPIERWEKIKDKKSHKNEE